MQGCGSSLGGKHGRCSRLKPRWTLSLSVGSVLPPSPHVPSLCPFPLAFSECHLPVFKWSKVHFWLFGFASFASMASTCCLWVAGKPGALPDDSSAGCFQRLLLKERRERQGLFQDSCLLCMSRNRKESGYRMLRGGKKHTEHLIHYGQNTV